MRITMCLNRIAERVANMIGFQRIQKVAVKKLGRTAPLSEVHVLKVLDK
jgi:hypothetical protein